MSRFEHATVLIRYGDTPLIRALYPVDRWEVIEAESATQTNAVKPELWIRNRPR